METIFYKRNYHMINKMLKSIEGGYSRKKEEDFLEKELIRFENYPELTSIDVHNFMLLGAYSLFGLNKEGIERSENNYDYELFPKLDIEEAKKSLYFREKYEQFENGRIIDTKFNDWLAITKINNTNNISNGFLFNVRNAFMHSEFSIEEKDATIINLKNSNYTGFEAKIMIPCFINFSNLYFGNNYWSGVVENHYGVYLPDKSITNDDEFKEMLKEADIRVSNIKDKKIIKKLHTLARKHAEKAMGEVLYENSLPVNFNDKLDLVFDSIKAIYNNDFYNFDLQKQGRIISSVIKFILDSKSVISDWIVHYMYLANSVFFGELNNDEFSSIFAAKPSLLIIKSYIIMYLLQNKNLEEIDYSNIYIPKHLYSDNLGTTTSTLTDPKLFCDIYRNSFAHGNVDVKLEIANSKLETKITLNDKYKTRERTIEINMEELEKFLESEPFLLLNCIKEDTFKGITR